MLACVAGLTGCGATGSASDGAGYAALHPSAETRRFILANDDPFVREVAGHNKQCSRDAACRK